MSNNVCAAEAELLGEREALADRDHRDAEDHVVADLGGLAVAGRPGMNDRPPHCLQDRPGALEGPALAPDHEGQLAVPRR